MIHRSPHRLPLLPPTPLGIRWLRDACAATGADLDAVIGTGRMAQDIADRDAVIEHLRYVQGRSYPEIAEAMQRRSWSGAVTAMKRIDAKRRAAGLPVGVEASVRAAA